MVLQTTKQVGFEAQTENRSKQDVLIEKLGIQKALTETLIEVARNTDDTSKFDVARDVLDAGLYNIVILQEQLDGRSFGSSHESQKDETRRGILAEVCATLALEKLGFRIINSSAGEDLEHGVDLYAEAPEKYGEGQIWAIQIKGFRSVETPVVLNLKNLRASENEMMQLTDNQVENLAESSNLLINYLSDKKTNPYTEHPDFVDDFFVRPIAILIPTGNTDGAFKRNGEPLPNFPQQLEQAINKTLPPKQSSTKPKVAVLD